MKTITITSAQRPEYFINAINSIKDNNVEGYKLFINCEPNDTNIQIAKDIDFIDTDIEINDRVLGVRDNPFRVLNRAFDAGSEFNIHLEEDIIISEDCVDLCNWYYNQYKDNPLAYHSYNLCNYKSDPTEPELIAVSNDFTVIGWAAFKDNWESYFKPYWFDDALNAKVWGPRTVGWDWAIQANRKENGLKLLKPVAARATHIGKFGGVHCSPQHQDSVFGNIVMCSETDINYELDTEYEID